MLKIMLAQSTKAYLLMYNVINQVRNVYKLHKS